jgi:asparaginyl-tRNA synthetase
MLIQNPVQHVKESHQTPHFLKIIEDPWYQTVALLQDKISLLTHTFFARQRIKTLHLPITTGSISSPMGLGSDSEPVLIDLFGVKTYLADSMQFLLEYGCRIFKEGCYYLMPSFRGETVDERHLCQFYHSEAEIPGDLGQAMCLVNEYIQYLAGGLLDHCADAINKMTGRLDHLEDAVKDNRITEITFDQATKLLDEYANIKKLPVQYFYKKVDENARVLTSLGEQILIKTLHGRAWITHYDDRAVPFYQAVSKAHPGKANNADLLFGIGEVVGVGERHVTDKDLLASIYNHHIDAKKYEWYVQLKEKYPLKTAGFGMGIERFILWALDHDDIRDCQLFPRVNGEDIVP